MVIVEAQINSLGASIKASTEDMVFNNSTDLKLVMNKTILKMLQEIDFTYSDYDSGHSTFFGFFENVRNILLEVKKDKIVEI